MSAAFISATYSTYARPECQRRKGRRKENANAWRSSPYQNIVVSLFFSFIFSNLSTVLYPHLWWSCYLIYHHSFKKDVKSGNIIRANILILYQSQKLVVTLLVKYFVELLRTTIWLKFLKMDIFSKSCHLFFNFIGCFWVLLALSHLPQLIFLVNDVGQSQ